MPGLTSDVIGCLAKIMNIQELILASSKIFNALPDSKIGSKGYMGVRIQPNSPTNNPEDIIWQVFDGFSYAVGDVMLGSNPAVIIFIYKKNFFFFFFFFYLLIFFFFGFFFFLPFQFFICLASKESFIFFFFTANCIYNLFFNDSKFLKLFYTKINFFKSVIIFQIYIYL